MCGIAGIFRFSNKEVNIIEIRKLTDAIKYRGPDGEGCWIHPKRFLGLGHRRLSILDLNDSGAQPMQYGDGRLTIVYNGEIFNFDEIRSDLKSKGYIFYSDSDTEVLLAAYYEWGKDCLKLFNGFWSFALWDELSKELWLARDRFGIKPLYYLYRPGFDFIFGSDTVQFKNITDYNRDFDSKYVNYIIQNPWGLDGFGKTIFKQIEQVRPGHYLTVKLDGSLQETRWWSTADHLEDINEDFKTQTNHFYSLFEDSVKLRLRSDVSIASALSGGLDSSSIYCTIHRLALSNKKIYRLPSEWQRAYIADFSGTTQDERKYAELVLEHTKGAGEFFDLGLQADLVSRLVNSIGLYDTIYSTPLFILDGVYGAMHANGIKVSMDGHGVDEMLYGYPTSVYQALKFANSQNDKIYATDVKDTYISMLPPDQQSFKLREFENNNISFIGRQLKKIQYKFQRKGIGAEWHEPCELDNLFLPQIEVPEHFNIAESQLYIAFHYTILPTILRNFDRGAMLNSIEVRMPFLDYRLVSYVFSLPMQSKLGGGFTKRILREAMKGILPEKIRTRKLKTGFNAPLQNWFENDLKEFLIDEVNSLSFLSSPFWNGKVIRDFVMLKSKHGKWTEAESFKLWPILNAHLLFKM